MSTGSMTTGAIDSFARPGNLPATTAAPAPAAADGAQTAAAAMAAWIGRREARHAAARTGAGLKEQLDARGGRPGLGEAALRAACAWESGAAEDAPCPAPADARCLARAEQAAAFLAAPAFETDVLDRLAREGTPQHPHESAPEAWDLHIALLRAELARFRRGGPAACSESFRAVAAVLAYAEGATALDAEAAYAELCAYFDRPAVWAALVRRANYARIDAFAAEDVAGYVANLQDCVETWFRALSAADGAEAITVTDAAWLQGEYARLAAPLDQPEACADGSFHFSHQALSNIAEAMRKQLREDGAALMIGAGGFAERQARAAQLAHEGVLIDAADFAAWHDGYFSEAIVLRRARQGG